MLAGSKQTHTGAVEVFYSSSESPLCHLGTCPFKASTPTQEEFEKRYYLSKDFKEETTSPRLPGDPRHQNTQYVVSRLVPAGIATAGPATTGCSLQLRCVLSLQFTNERWRRANGHPLLQTCDRILGTRTATKTNSTPKLRSA
jgi:hypothetical protein